MPIETSVEGDLVTFRVTGLPKALQIVETITNHFSRTPTKLALWDLRDAILADIDAAEFERLMVHADQFAGVRGPRAGEGRCHQHPVLCRPRIGASVAAQFRVTHRAPASA